MHAERRSDVHCHMKSTFGDAGQAFDSGGSVGLDPNRTLAAYVSGRNVGSLWALKFKFTGLRCFQVAPICS